MASQAFSEQLSSKLAKPFTPKNIMTDCFPPTPPPDTPTLDKENLLWAATSDLTATGQLTPVDAEPIVAVIGVGYVGTHLVEAFAHHYKVIAFDLSKARLEIVSKQLDGLSIQFTSEASELSAASHVLVSVPTVLNDDKTIDTTYLRSAIATVEKHVKPGSTVIVESSVAVGMTRSLLGPLIESKKLKVGMSPEVCAISHSVFTDHFLTRLLVASRSWKSLTRL